MPANFFMGITDQHMVDDKIKVVGSFNLEREFHWLQLIGYFCFACYLVEKCDRF